MKPETLRAIEKMMIAAVKAKGGDPSNAVITICRPPKHRQWLRDDTQTSRTSPASTTIADRGEIYE